MILRTTIQPAWTIARSMWMARQRGFLALLSAPLICGWLFHLLSSAFLKGDGANFLGYLPMGLSIFLTFIFCNFTEIDRRGRFDGFPARLFALPVSTHTLIATPILFSVFAVTVIYFVWAKFALPALGKELPLSWPVLYLAAGMICYQTIVWSLARFRIARLFALGIGGTFLAIGWIFFWSESENLFFSWLPNGFGAHSFLCTMLVVINLAALLAANIVIENQRRGGLSQWSKWKIGREQNNLRESWHAQRTLVERITDALPRRQKCFTSPARTQLWFEWRRHGSLLPLATGGVLLLIIAPAPFCAPISAEPAGIILCWMLALPLLLAFVLGKGFGKADLWSKEPSLPLFQGTRPLNNTDWIGAKIKAATLAVASAWLIVLLTIPLWLWLFCDYKSMFHEFQMAASRDPKVISVSIVAIPILILLTWRFLVGSLYIGLSGKSWMLNVSACGVFLSFFSPAIGAIPIVQRNLHHLLFPPKWLALLLGSLLAAKLLTAILLTSYAHRKDFVTARAIRNYVAIWLGVAALLVALVWRLIPFEMIPPNSGWNKASFALLIIFAVPVLRISYAPIALAQNRRR